MARPRGFDEDTAVRAAMELFWAQGYRATTPAELGEAIGIGRGSLYNAFDSKHALFLRALGTYVAEQREQFVAALDGPGSTRDRIRRALGIVLDGHPQPRGCMITTAAVETPADDLATADAVRAVLSAQRELLTDLIRVGRLSGELADGPDVADPAEVADAIIALLNGVRVMQRAGTPPTTSLVDVAMRLL